jgi:hypothetical protein
MAEPGGKQADFKRPSNRGRQAQAKADPPGAQRGAVPVEDF